MSTATLDSLVSEAQAATGLNLLELRDLLEARERAVALGCGSPHCECHCHGHRRGGH